MIEIAGGILLAIFALIILGLAIRYWIATLVILAVIAVIVAVMVEAIAWEKIALVGGLWAILAAFEILTDRFKSKKNHNVTR